MILFRGFKIDCIMIMIMIAEPEKESCWCTHAKPVNLLPVFSMIAVSDWLTGVN